jgi:type IV secretion system protein TrbL
MNTDLLNMVVAAFNSTLDSAFAALHVYSVGLLSALGLMHLLLAVGRLMSAGGTANLAALGEFLWVVVRIGVFLFLVIALDFLMDAAFLTFLDWGVRAGGGGFSMADFLNPSRTVEAGSRAAAPLLDAIGNLIGWGILWGLPKMWWWGMAYWANLVTILFTSVRNEADCVGLA